MSELQRAWNDLRLSVRGEPARTAKYRRLQSWYREHELHAEHGFVVRKGGSRPVGSLLSEQAVQERPDLNFLDPVAASYARRRVPVVQAQGGSIDQVRLTRNMLSSMPLSFNIFGALRPRLELADLLRDALDLDIALVETVECEWSPGPARTTELGLGDRTAFDAFVSYVTAIGERGFLAVETKYTEPFSQREYEVTDAYRDATDNSGWFQRGSANELKRSSTNQLWRNTMLAARLLQNTKLWNHAHVIVLRLEDDPGADQAIDGVRRQLLDTDLLRHCSYEDLVSTAQGIDSLKRWAAAFKLRYLDTTVSES